MKLRLPQLFLFALLFCFMFLANANTADAGIFKKFRERHGCSAGGCTASSGGTSHAGRPIAALALAGGGCATCK